MGITNFHKWIKTNHSSCIQSIDKMIETDHLYIDVNFCLHNVVYNTKKFDVLLKKFCTFVDNMLLKIKPFKSITFATDGPAPYAKLILQRLRRQNMARNLNYDIDSCEVNPICFTPGTKFMLDFGSKLENYIENLKEKYNIKIFELFKGPDEAELKIISQLLKNNNKFPNDNHIILSNDADVIVMTSVTKCYDKISIAVKLKKELNLFNVKKFSEIINIDHIKNYQNNLDIGFISLFMGNDYLPKLMYISFDGLLKAYRCTLIKNKKGLINKDYSINVNFFKDFMLSLASSFKNSAWINSFSILNFNQKMYKNYLEGLVWCIDSYKSGICNKYDYMYNYKQSPHPLGIHYYLLFGSKIQIPEPFPIPIPDHIYALLIIPKKAINLIDAKYHIAMNKYLNFLYEEEICDICCELHTKLSGLYKTIKYMTIMEQDTSKIKQVQKLSTSLSKKLAIHRKIHKNISLKDINFVINKFK